jgi:hypothetical protein
LYGQNFTEGLRFRHFLIFGGVLGAISVILYLLISQFWLRRRRTVFLLAVFWSFFWFFGEMKGLASRAGYAVSERSLAICLAFLLIALGFMLRQTKMSRLVANVAALALCTLFIFNFAPQATAVYAGYSQGLENTRSSELPYEIKSDFYVDPNLPRPNIYWLHMDGMMGFSAVERYFGDPQTELKDELYQRGFVINEGAWLVAGYTQAAMPALFSPGFFDSYFGEQLAGTATMTRGDRQLFLISSLREDGVDLWNDVWPYPEVFKAFSDAGYANVSNQTGILDSRDVDMKVSGSNTVFGALEARAANQGFDVLNSDMMRNFKDLVVAASILSLEKASIDGWMDNWIEEKKWSGGTQQIPEFAETVNMYVTGESDKAGHMGTAVRAMRYAATAQAPHFWEYANYTAHNIKINGNKIGNVEYDEYIGQTFIYDENGNIYKEPLDDPSDPWLYYPQHIYAVKEMMAQVDTILAYDPEAVIVIQGDHGIHGIGPARTYYDSDFMFARGYSHEDQVYLNLQVMSAVRIPPQYGELTEPLDPLDIARYLVNHFIGGGNYEYLFYTEKEDLL